METLKVFYISLENIELEVQLLNGRGVSMFGIFLAVMVISFFMLVPIMFIMLVNIVKTKIGNSSSVKITQSKLYKVYILTFGLLFFISMIGMMLVVPNNSEENLPTSSSQSRETNTEMSDEDQEFFLKVTSVIREVGIDQLLGEIIRNYQFDVRILRLDFEMLKSSEDKLEDEVIDRIDEFTHTHTLVMKHIFQNKEVEKLVVDKDTYDMGKRYFNKIDKYVKELVEAYEDNNMQKCLSSIRNLDSLINQ